METAKIIFKDGTEIETEVNGNNFITSAEPEFPEDLSEVTVQKGEEEIVLYNVSVQRTYCGTDPRYWFLLNEETEYERTIRELHEENDMLIECILEMSEIIYGE